MTGLRTAQPQRVGWYNKRCQLFRVDTVPLDISVEVYIANCRRIEPETLRDCDYVILEN